MNCEILHTLYVRSNGDVPCNDDAGERVLLGRIRSTASDWSADALLQNHRYRQVRAALQAGEAPWPDLCPGCAFFRPREAYADHLAQRRLRKLQIEPSLACRLRCPGCSNHLQAQVRPGPLLMDLAVFSQVLAGLRRENYQLGEIEYCGQGEPLLHPQFPAFVRLARETFPRTPQRLITSGNFDYQAGAGVAVPDEIMVSCDGAFAASYARYRVGGRIDRPLRFMRAALQTDHPTRPVVIWKYILFEWNDSDEELRAAQELARELGVAALLFVFTHSAGKSRRFTPANAGALPRHLPALVLNATPIHYQLEPVPV